MFTFAKSRYTYVYLSLVYVNYITLFFVGIESLFWHVKSNSICLFLKYIPSDFLSCLFVKYIPSDFQI